jgi:hypothetical protein
MPKSLAEQFLEYGQKFVGAASPGVDSFDSGTEEFAAFGVIDFLSLLREITDSGLCALKVRADLFADEAAGQTL